MKSRRGRQSTITRFVAALFAGFALTLGLGSTPAQVRVKSEPPPPRLLAGLKSKDAVTRRNSAVELGSIRARDAYKQLASALLDKSPGVREAAAFAIGQITEPRAVDSLLGVFADKDPEVRASVAFALGMIGDRRASKALSNALDEDDVAVRSAAVTALGLLQDGAAVEEVVAALDDPSIDVRYDAVWALGQIADPDAEEHLYAALVNLNLANVDDAVLEAYRQAVQFSIARIKWEQERLSRPRRAVGGGAQGVSTGDVLAKVTRPTIVVEALDAASTQRALRAGIKGTVSLKVLVGVESRAIRAYVTRRLGYGLDQRAVQAVLLYKFDAEVKDGMPQTTWINMEVKF